MSQITNDNYKPSLFDEDELAHYGVKGMRWGVRRTPAQLGSARGDRKAEDRSSGRTPPKGKGRGPAIREARRSTKEAYNKKQRAAVTRNQKAQVVRDVVDKGTGLKDRNQEPNASQKDILKTVWDSPEYKKAQADFEKARVDFEKASKDYKDNPERAAAVRITYGEAAAIMLLTTPVGAITYTVATAAIGRNVARNQRERANRSS